MKQFFFKPLSILLLFSFVLSGCQKFSTDMASVIDNSSFGGGDGGGNDGGNDGGNKPIPSILEKYPDVRPLWENKKSDGRNWTTHVIQQLNIIGKDLTDVIPADADLFCPRYGSLSLEERKYFWAFFISSMVRFESNFKPETFFEESFDDANGKPVISRGLLQISIESSRGYDCGFTAESQLHDPLKNLSCGIRILNRWLANDGRFAGFVDNKWRGGARYWSVLRAGDKTSYNSIVNWSRNLSMCK